MFRRVFLQPVRSLELIGKLEEHAVSTLACGRAKGSARLEACGSQHDFQVLPFPDLDQQADFATEVGILTGGAQVDACIAQESGGVYLPKLMVAERQATPGGHIKPDGGGGNGEIR